MSNLLYIVASPRDGRSHSIALAQAFLDAYRRRNPNDTIKVLDLFKEQLPPFDGPALNVKYAILHGTAPTLAERTAWKPIEDRINEFKSADKYVLAVPMWNFGIPYRLKHYIDLIVQPTYTFAYIPGQGYKGLVTGKPVFIAYARGGGYGTDVTFDYQKRYLECILNFVGLTDVRSVVIEGTLMKSKEDLKKDQDNAIAQAQKMAEAF